MSWEPSELLKDKMSERTDAIPLNEGWLAMLRSKINHKQLLSSEVQGKYRYKVRVINDDLSCSSCGYIWHFFFFISLNKKVKLANVMTVITNSIFYNPEIILFRTLSIGGYGVHAIFFRFELN